MNEEECDPCTAAAVSVANMVCKDLRKMDVDCGQLR